MFSFSVLGQAFESLGQIVAPIDNEQSEDENASRSESSTTNYQDKGSDDFDGDIRKFIDERRSEYLAEHKLPKVEVSLNLTDSLPPIPPSQPALISSESSVSFDRGTLLTPEVGPNQVSRQHHQRREEEIRQDELRYQILQLESEKTVLRQEFEKWKKNCTEIGDSPNEAAAIENIDTIAHLEHCLNTDRLLKYKYQSSINDLEAEKSASIEELATLRRMVSNLEHQISEYQEKDTENASLQNELIKLKEEHLTLLSEFSEKDTAICKLIRELQETYITDKSSIAKVSSADESLKLMLSFREQLQNQLLDSQGRLISLDCQVADFKSEIDSKNQRILDLEQVLHEREGQILCIQNLYEMTNDKLDKANEKLFLAENESQRFREAFETATANVGTDFQRDLIDLQSKYDQLLMEKYRLEKEIDLSKERNSKLEVEHQSWDALLLESEANLKLAEEVAWKSKAEAAEYLSAYEIEASISIQLRNQLEEVQQHSISNTEDWCRVIRTVKNCLVHLCTSSDEAFITSVKEFEKATSRFDIGNISGLFEEINNLLCQTRRFMSSFDRLRDVLMMDIDESNEEKKYIVIVDAVSKVVQQLKDLKKDLDHHQKIIQQLQHRMEERERLAEEAILAFQRDNAEIKSELGRCKLDLEKGSFEQERTVQILHEQLKESKLTISKMETEQKNLQVVIAQLRNAGRAKFGEAESVQQELQNLKCFNNALVKEMDDLKRTLKRVEDYDVIAHDRERLFAELQTMENIVADMKLHQALIENDLYAKATANETLLSELKMLKQDLSSRLEEVENLQDAMQQLHSDHKHEINCYKASLQEAQKQMVIEQSAEAKRENEFLMVRVQELEAEINRLRDVCEDHILLRRQIELSFHQEKRRMELSINQVVAQMKNSTHDVIDRTLIANLIVSYFQRRRSFEVLQLIAKVLCFNEEQLVIVGLKVPPMNFLSSIFNTVLGPTDPVPVEGNNLAEMWVNYLIHQAEDAHHKQTGASVANIKETKPTSVENEA